MSDEENTKEMTFEQRLFARLDAQDDLLRSHGNLLRSLIERVEALEQQNEWRAMETKPMWEKALAEIQETRNEMREGFAKLSSQLSVMNDELLAVKGEQRRLGTRVTDLERKPS